jgi:hypothetical protein
MFESLPLPGSSQIGVGFGDIIPSHPRLPNFPITRFCLPSPPTASQYAFCSTVPVFSTDGFVRMVQCRLFCASRCVPFLPFQGAAIGVLPHHAPPEPTLRPGKLRAKRPLISSPFHFTSFLFCLTRRGNSIIKRRWNSPVPALASEQIQTWVVLSQHCLFALFGYSRPCLIPGEISEPRDSRSRSGFQPAMRRQGT